MLARIHRVLCAGALITAGVLACAPATSSSLRESRRISSVPPLTPTSRVIDGERIARSGAQSALDAIRALIPNHRLSPSASATMPWLNTRAMSRETPRVLVDGHMVGDVESLRMIPAHEVVAIHVLSPSDAMIRFGPQYDGGAIVIQTRASMRRL